MAQLVKEQPLPCIVVIGISYESDEAAFEFVRTLKSISNSNFVQVVPVIVDNSERSSSTEFFEKVRCLSPATICVKSPMNVGYFGGARLGLDRYRSAFGTAFDWLIISNVDIRFTDANFFSNLLTFKSNDEVGIVAPTIWSKIRERDWNPYLENRPPNIYMSFLAFISRTYVLQSCYMALSRIKDVMKILLRRLEKLLFVEYMFQHKALQLKEIYSPRGACLAFSKQYFSKGGNLNHPAFLYSEETFVAETVARIGLKVIYNPYMKVHHDDHVSTSKIPPRKRARYFADSINAIRKMFYN